ncbi:hypothetical protein [Flavobacterium sp.]|uniref:hypothetical protein n=1 Tax=Flavobacterium sp. TaxID=239 RepID=UPI0031D3ABA3
MKKFIFLALIILSVNCNSQVNKCSYFKNGTFIYKNPNFSNFIVTRNGNVQVEEDQIRHIIIEGTVKWISECEYILTYTKIDVPKLKKLIGQTVIVKINEIDNNKIKCLSKMNDISLELEMVKIK